MKKHVLFLLSFLVIHSVLADQLDGLAVLNYLVYVLLLEAIAILVLLFSTGYRFTQKEQKVNPTLNVSATIIIICSLFAIDDLGYGIDPGFLSFSIGMIGLSLLLIFLNYFVGRKKRGKKS